MDKQNILKEEQTVFNFTVIENMQLFLSAVLNALMTGLPNTCV